MLTVIVGAAALILVVQLAQAIGTFLYLRAILRRFDFGANALRGATECILAQKNLIQVLQEKGPKPIQADSDS